MLKIICKLLLACLLTCFGLSNTRAGIYKTIAIDGNNADWSDVPVAIDNSGSTASPLNITTVKFANDNNYFYLLVNFQTPVNPNSGAPTLYLALDNDSNKATGYDVYGAGKIGSEVGWQNDFPFEQTNGNFNTGNGINNGGLLISPYNSTTSYQEIAVPRNATFAGGANAGQSIFPNSSFTFGLYSDGNSGSQEFVVGDYTFAVPEPGTYVSASVLLIFAGVTYRRRLFSRFAPAGARCALPE